MLFHNIMFFRNSPVPFICSGGIACRSSAVKVDHLIRGVVIYHLGMTNIAMVIYGPFIDDFPIEPSIYGGDSPWLC